MDGYDLMRRCQDAARLAVWGSDYSSEDRADCASHLIEWVLQRTPGASNQSGCLPMVSDPHVSLHSLIRQAGDWRRSLDRIRATETRAVKADQDLRTAQWTNALDALDPTVLRVAREDAEDAATAGMRRLSRDGVKWSVGGSVWLALYGACRDFSDADVAAELNRPDVETLAPMGRRAIQVAVSGDPIVLLDTLTGGWSGRDKDGRLIYVTRDEREARIRMAGSMALDWRSGTNGGEWPERPTSAEGAREACSVSQTHPRKMTLKLARRSMWASFSTGATTHFHTVAGGRRGRMQAIADGRRALGRQMAGGRRERSVIYQAPR
jgi:hypothetical protein